MEKFSMLADWIFWYIIMQMVCTALLFIGTLWYFISRWYRRRKFRTPIRIRIKELNERLNAFEEEFYQFRFNYETTHTSKKSRRK